MHKTIRAIITAFIMLATLGTARADNTAQQSGVSPATLFTFRHVVVDTSTAAPAICLRFSQNLNTSPAAHYEDYLKLSPAITPAISVSGTDLCLSGLNPATSYKVTILHGLPAASGAKLATDQKLPLALADDSPLVAISGDGFILSRNTANGLTIQTVNVTKVKIHVLRMSDKLIPQQLTGGNLTLSTNMMAPYDLNSLLQNTVSIAWTGTMTIPADHNRTVSTAFPIASLIPPGRDGLYLVVAENAQNALPDSVFTGPADPNADAETTIAAHWVVATDLALTSFSGSDGLHVFARSLTTAQPLANVEVRLISTGDDVLGQVLTDANGEADFPTPLMAGTRANAPTTLLAYGGGNFAFQNLTAPAFDLSDRGVSGRAAPHDFQAFMYTERGIYRPGETINLMALLRDRTGNAVTNLPLKILLRRPDGVVDRSILAPPAPDGGILLPIALSPTAARGLWSIEAYIDPTAPAIGRVQADVEDFVPQQLKVTLTTNQKYLNPTDSLTGSLSGAFLYGAPAANLHAQGDLRIVRDNNPVANASGYAFGLVDDKVDDMDQSLTLPDADDKGNLQISAPLPQLPNTSVPLKAILTAGLFEPSGRYVSDVTEVPIRAQPLLIGIKPLFPDDQVGDGEPAKFDIATFGPTGAPTATQNLTWTLVEENQIFDWFEDNNSDWTWHYHTEDQQLASGTISTTTAKPAEFTAPGLGEYDWGTYRLIVTDNTSGAATSVRFNIGWDTTGTSVSTPDKAEVLAEKTLLNPGESTKLHIKGPFAGTAQIVIANDRVFSTQTIAVPKAGATVSIKADSAWGAGAYAIVTMIRPLAAAGPQQPIRAIGVAWLGINPASHTLSVAIAAPAKITPRQTVTIPVKITGAMPGDTPYVTLSAVDEGILQLTSFTTPDPLSFLYGKLNLAMDIRDDYGNLLDGSADPGAIEQGGDGASLGGPGLPVTSSKVVSLFSGPVTVGANGIAQIPIAVPDFEGQLRLMAVAYDKTQAGAAQATLIVRDPVIEDVAVPRFLAPGDTASLAISLHNTDGPPGAYTIKLTSTGAASITAAKTVTLATGQRIQTAALIAAKSVGIVTINADLTGPAHYAVHRSWQLAVRAPHYPVTLQSIALQAKDTDFKPDPKLLASFEPGSLAVTIGYAAYQGIDVPSLLQSLWLYPYGCTEQMTSTAFPLLYYNQNLLAAALPSEDSDWQDTSNEGVKSRVQDAIDTILDRQDDTGTFGLWSVGDGEASAWLNVYTMDFLLHAKAAGYAVPDDALSRGDGHLLSLVQQIDSGAEGDSYTEQGLEAPQATLAYAEYVLAGTSQADLGLLRRMNDAAIFATDTDGAPVQYAYWSAAASGSTLDDNSLAEPLALAQLGGALSLMGDKFRSANAFQMAVANIGVQTTPVWWTDDAYYSQTRDLAGMIAIAAETGNTDLTNQLLVKLIALKVNPDELSTQDQAWLLAAANALDKNAKNISLVLNNKPLTLPLPAAFAPTPAQITAGYTIKNTSQQDLWRTFTATGAPAIALPAISQGYSLQKAYFNIDGTPLDPTQLKQNDRFIVDLSGQVNDDDDHRTVVVDLLPAGWEIEAPITDDSTDYGFLGPLSQTRVIEARDDRFVAAFDLGSDWPNSSDSTNDSDDHLDPNQFHVAYLVRAVTPGSFTLPEAEINDMYRPAVMARTASSHTTITAK